MTKTGHFIAAVAALACGACNLKYQEPEVGGETNWLIVCEQDDDCAIGSCVCGVCTSECNTAGDCDAELRAVCMPSEMAANGACAPRVCLPRCQEDDACGEGFRCAEGACVPLVAWSESAGGPSPADAGMLLPPSMTVTETLASQEITIEGEQDGTIGFANAIVGDLDRDGYDDFVVLDYGGSGSMANRYGLRGAAYVFYGRADFPESIDVLEADAVLRGGDEVGRGLGDVDQDGYDDFAFSSRAGAHVIFGGEERLSGEHVASEVGTLLTLGDQPASPAPDDLGAWYLVAAAGDVNGNGHPDLLVQTNDLTAETRATLLFDGASLRGSSRVLLPADGTPIEGIRAGGGGGVGDVNGDGYDDLAIIVSHEVPWSTVLFYGKPSLLEKPIKVSHAAATWKDDVLSATLGSAGDVNGDGYDDFAIGDEYRLAVVFGRASRLRGTQSIARADVVIDRQTEPGYLAGVGFGDIDGDGWPEVLIGDPHHEHNGPQSGALYALPQVGRMQGSHRLTASNVVRFGSDLPSPGLGEDLGYGTASGGDVNGDGFHDVLVGAGGDVVGDEHGGTTYLLLGGR